MKNSLYIIPMIFVRLIKTEYNTHFLSILILMLTQYNIETNDKNTGSMTGFSIEGSENVFDKLLPLFLENHFLFYSTGNTLLLSYFYVLNVLWIFLIDITVSMVLLKSLLLSTAMRKNVKNL